MKHWSFLPIITVTLATTLLTTACQPNKNNHQVKAQNSYGKINGKTMGTTYNITFEIPESVNQTEIQAKIDERLLAFNNELSTWQEDSTISKFNRVPTGTTVGIQSDFLKVFEDSQLVYEQSGGAFDPTVKPILELWGFGKESRVDKLQHPPTDTETAKARELIDFDSIGFDEKNMARKEVAEYLVKHKEGVTIDFSAIAKGYGVDVIADVLQSEYQISNYMVEIGGEVATSGVNNRGQSWQIGIDAPIAHSGVTNRQLIATIVQPMNDQKQSGSMHLATSGNYRNSIVFDGIRYSHTIDPHTGRPVAGGASSVTVADDTVALADAWATALTAMPYEKALKMAQDLDKAVMFIVLKDDVDANNESHGIDDWQIVETKKMKAMRSGK